MPLTQPQLSLEWAVEEALIQILNQTPAMLALAPVHADSDQDTENVRITVKAESVVRVAPNPRNWQLNVRKAICRVQLRHSLGQMDATTLYTTYGIMTQILENMDGEVYGGLPAITYFLYLEPTLELENAREKDEQRRKMYKMVSMLAILRAPPIVQ